MLAAWLLAARAHAAILVEGPEPGCPGRDQVAAALEARLPGATAGGESGRRLEIEPAAPGVAVRLRDGAGAVVLERQLRLDGRTAASSTRAEGCQTLAEAAALVVVRYLREIGFRPPSAAVLERPAEPPVVTSEPPPPPVAPSAPGPPWATAGLLGVGGAGRVGTGGSSASPRVEAMVGLATHVGLLAVELGGGISDQSVIPVPASGGGELRLRAFPLRGALGVPLSIPGGTLVPTAGMSLDLLSFRAAGLADARSGLRVDPAVELGASYLVARRRLYVRARLATGLALAPRDFRVGSGTLPVFRTADAYFRAQIELGLVLWKNGSPGTL
jgi:hypothetical protein